VYASTLTMFGFLFKRNKNADKQQGKRCSKEPNLSSNLSIQLLQPGRMDRMDESQNNSFVNKDSVSSSSVVSVSTNSLSPSSSAPTSMSESQQQHPQISTRDSTSSSSSSGFISIDPSFSVKDQKSDVDDVGGSFIRVTTGSEDGIEFIDDLIRSDCDIDIDNDAVSNSTSPPSTTRLDCCDSKYIVSISNAIYSL
jgi:hypothetical protein